MRGSRVLVVALLVAAVLALVPGQAAVATGGELDPVFGNGGTTLIDSRRPSVDVAWSAAGDPTTERVTLAGAAGQRMAVARSHRSGSPDSFGSDGLVTADFGQPAVAYGVTQTLDGVLAVGRAGDDLAAAAFDDDGRPRLAFGSSGRLVVPLSGASVARAVSARGVVVGSVVNGGDRDILLARLDTWGLDVGFNGTGTRIADLAPGVDDEAMALTTVTGSGFYLAGRLGDAALVARFNVTDGTLDDSFGTDGAVLLDLTAGPDVARALAHDSSGGVFVVGQAGDHAFAAQLSSAGLPAAGFGGGVVEFDLGGTADTATGVVREPGASLIVSGTRTTLLGSDPVARRLTATGAIEPGFGTNGLLVADFGSTSDQAAAAVALKDGRFALVGGDGADMVAARFNADSTADTYLDADGRVSIDANGWDAQGMARLAPDGRVVVGGTSAGQVVLARLLADGRVDPTFGDGSPVLDDFGDGEALDLAVQPDGRIVVLVKTNHITFGVIGRLVRYLSDGRRDPSFGEGGLGGFVRHPGPRLHLLADGRTLIAGSAVNGHLGVARFLASGGADASFGEGGHATAFTGDQRGSSIGNPGVQSDGAILLPIGFDDDRLAVARFSSSGALLAVHGNYVGLGGAPVLALLADDRSYVTGTTTLDSAGRPTEIAVARLLPNGSLDSSFGTRGIVRFELGVSETVADAVMDGPFLAMAVNTYSNVDASTSVHRMTSTGQIDSRYGTGGRAAIPSLSLARTMVRDAAGRLVLGGAGGSDLAVVRLQPGPTAEPSPPNLVTIAAPPAPALALPVPSAPPRRSGYWMLARSGSTYAFGDAAWSGNAPTSDAVDLEPTPSGHGYWIVDGAGAVFALGDARHLGGAIRSQLGAGENVTSLSGTPSGAGYWLFTNRGRVLPFGDAAFRGDMGGTRLNGPVLDSVATPSGAGYYLVASDGGIFAFGDARFRGSMGGRPLNAPVESLVPDADGNGYWLVASDGGVFAFDAPFRGSMGGQRLNAPVSGMVRYGNGYVMVGQDGGVFNFSDKAFAGSLGTNPPPTPVVAVATLDR